MQAYQEIDEVHGQLLNVCNDAVFVHPFDHKKPGRFIDVNDIACARLGYTREELLDLSPSEIDADTMTTVRNRVLEELTQTGHAVFEMVHVGKTGNRIPVEISSRVFQSKGRLYVFSIARDISKRKRMEDALRESQTFMETIFEQSPFPMWVSDEKGVMLRMNQAIRDLLQVSDEELVGKYDVFKDEIVKQQGLMHLVERVFEEGERVHFPIEYDSSYLHKDPTPDSPKVVLEVTISPVLNAQNQVIHAIIQHRDITEQKHVENALRESEAVLRSLLNATPAGVALLNNRRFLKVNNSMCRITGYSEQELTNQLTRMLYLDNEEYQRIGRDLYVEMERRGLGINEVRLKKKDGTPIDVSLSLCPIDSQDVTAGVCATVLDITERKRAEEALEKRMIALIRPLDSPEGISFEDLFNLEDIQRLQEEFAQATGVATIITNTDGTPITKPSNFCRLCSDIIRQSEASSANCHRSDALLGLICVEGPTIRPCLSAGLWGAGASIKVGGRHIANWLIGQVRDETQTEEKMRAYAREVGLDEEAVIEAYLEVPIMSRVQFEKIAQALFTLANQLSNFAYQNVQQARFITERKQAEEELRESEKRFRMLADLAPVGIIISDREEKTLFISRKCVEMLGYDQNDFSTVEEWWPLAYPDPILRERIRLEWTETLRKARETGVETPPMEYPVTGKDGRVHQIEFRLATTGDLNFIVLTDITDRKKAEEALLRTQFAMDRASDSILWVDRDATIVYANNAACSSMEYSREELLQMKVYDIDPDFNHTKWEQLAEELLRDGSVRFESHHRTKSGRDFPVEVTSNYLEFNGGFLNCSFDRDLTDRKRAEEERERLQEQLNQAQKMESVGRLAGGVAHDFNNMLGVILGHTELGLGLVDPEHLLSVHLQEIQRAASRSADLTRQLLAFARQQTVAPKVLDLNDTVEGMLKMLRRLIGEDIHLAWLPGAGLWPIKVDPSQIDQILANLCVNSRDAITGMGKITIETSMVTLDEAYCSSREGVVPGDYVLLEVSDNGCGMDQETLGKVFEPFFTTKELGKGTGLGLATVYGIVKQNNGFISVYSELGLGTVFKIYLPRHAGESKKRREESLTAPTEMGHETILLVEDESAILDIARMILERLGYVVLATSTPREAIHQAKEHAKGIDLLITDVIMPEMNGRELADHLQTIHPGIRTLFMSGYTANVIAHSGVLEEGVYFIQKPFTMKDLAGKVRDALEPKDDSQT